MAEHLVEVENLKMYFKKVTGIVKRKTAYIKAVDNISFTIDKGETFGLVGESGCGKTTTGRTIIRLYDPTDGTIRYDGQDVTHLSPKEFMPYRKRMQMIFSGPLRFPQRPDDGVGYCRRAPGHPPSAHRKRTRGIYHGPAQPGWAEQRPCQPLSP